MAGTLTTDEIVSLAQDLGADRVGVGSASVFRRERESLEAAVGSGRSGPLHFTYADSDVATEVTSTFPWAKHIVTVSRAYVPEAAGPPATGAVVARFASEDRYSPLRLITEAIAAALREQGFRAESLIDDNRLVDRGAAVRSGVGWAGKSTMVLAPGPGPWILLGSVITDADLQETPEMVRGCGTCTACIPACPTAALDGSRLDARRCISTWLQSPGSLPLWIRAHVGRRIYGCDDCLTACPPGGKALESSRDAAPVLPFERLLDLDDAHLLDRYSWWYVPRREGRFIRRNLLVAAGNSGETSARGALEAHLSHPSSMIRGHAAWAMARGYGDDALDTLRNAAAEETVAEPLLEHEIALKMLEDPAGYQAIVDADEAEHMATSG